MVRMAIQTTRYETLHIRRQLTQYALRPGLTGKSRKHTRAGARHHCRTVLRQPIEVSSYFGILLNHHRLQIVDEHGVTELAN